MKPKATAIAATVEESVIASIQSTLKQEGLVQARAKWDVVNNMMSCEDWWPPVARAVRNLFDNYAEEKKKEEAERAQLQSKITFINSNNQTNQRQWNPVIGQAEQVIGMAENGSEVIHTKMEKVI